MKTLKSAGSMMTMNVERLIVVAVMLAAGLNAQDINPVEYCQSNWQTYDHAVIDVDAPTNFDTIRSLSGYFCRNGTVKIQIWRPAGMQLFELIWQYELHAPRQLPDIATAFLAESEYVSVQPIDRIGFAPVSGSYPLGQNFLPQYEGSMRASSFMVSSTPQVLGDTYQFIELLYPYKFAGVVCNTTDECEVPDITLTDRPLINQTTVAPTFPPGYPGPMGTTGLIGPMGLSGDIGLPGRLGGEGDLGPKGLTGDSGIDGPRGVVGLTGPAGPEGPEGPRGFTGLLLPVTSSCECRGFSDPSLVLGMLIWALLLTVLVFSMLVFATVKTEHIS